MCFSTGECPEGCVEEEEEEKVLEFVNVSAVERKTP